MVKKEGKIPVNARVDVDYSGEKPKIKFGYTGKNPSKQAVRQNLYGLHSILILLFLFIIFTGIVLQSSKYVPEPENCSVEFDEYHFNIYNLSEKVIDNHLVIFNYSFPSKSIKGFNLTCDNKTDYYDYVGFDGSIVEIDKPYFYRTLDSKELLKESGMKILPGILLIFLWYLLNKLFTKFLVKQKWYQKWMPKNKAGGKNRKKKYYKFKEKDVLDNVIVIPKFENVELTYNTSGDFSKKLKKIKIREYRHNVYKKQKVGKLKVDNYKWYAVFYFESKPRDGFMEVFYQ